MGQNRMPSKKSTWLATEHERTHRRLNSKKTYSSKVEQDIFKKETQVASKRFFSDPKAFPSLFADGSRSGDTGLPSPGKRRGAPGVHPFVPGFGVL